MTGHWSSRRLPAVLAAAALAVLPALAMASPAVAGDLPSPTITASLTFVQSRSVPGELVGGYLGLRVVVSGSGFPALADNEDFLVLVTDINDQHPHGPGRWGWPFTRSSLRASVRCTGSGLAQQCTFSHDGELNREEFPLINYSTDPHWNCDDWLLIQAQNHIPAEPVWQSNIVTLQIVCPPILWHR